MDEVRVGVLPPFLPSAQRVGYGRILSMLVIVIADRARRGSARRDPEVDRSGPNSPPEDGRLKTAFRTAQEGLGDAGWPQAPTAIGSRAAAQLPVRLQPETPETTRDTPIR